jgi:hypothetical protein
MQILQPTLISTIMKTTITALLLATFAMAYSQEYIKSDFSLGIDNETDMDILLDDEEHILLNRQFHFIALNDNYLPGETDTTLFSYDGIYRTHFGTTCWGNRQLLIYWFEYNGLKNYIKAITFDTDFTSPMDPIVVDSSISSYASILGFISKRPDAEKQIGLTWSKTDTVYAAFLNVETKTHSEKLAILKGTGAAGIQMVDFLYNGNIRVIWRDANGDVRHKVISKTGESIVNETVIINKAEYYETYGGLIDYSSNAAGRFLISEFHTNTQTYNYGIEVRTFNNQGELTGGPAWVCDSINISAWDDLTTYYDCAIQEDGKAVVVWRNMWYSQTLNNYLLMLYMQFIDESGNLCGSLFKPVKVNDESVNKSFLVLETYPIVKMKNDTVMLLWTNFNEELSLSPYLYMNLLKYKEPEVSAINNVNEAGLRHTFISNGDNGTGALLVESPFDGKAVLELYSISGSLLKTEELDLIQGENFIPFTPKTGRGIYLYRLTLNSVSVSGMAFDFVKN